MLHLHHILRRDEAAELLSREEVADGAAEFLLDWTGQDRHRERVIMALRTAFAVSLGWFVRDGEPDYARVRVVVKGRHLWHPDTEVRVSLTNPETCESEHDVGRTPFPDGNPVELVKVRARAWAVLAVDKIGVGGRGGVEGEATTRVPALRDLGKGRKHASDGAAWTAAIEDAREVLEGGSMFFRCKCVAGATEFRRQPPHRFVFRFLGDFDDEDTNDLRLGVVPWPTDEAGARESEAAGYDVGRIEIAEVEDLLPLAWVRSIAARTMLQVTVPRPEWESGMLVCHDGEHGDMAYFAAIFERAERGRLALERAEEEWSILAGEAGTRERREQILREEIPPLRYAYWQGGDPEIAPSTTLADGQFEATMQPQGSQAEAAEFVPPPA